MKCESFCYWLQGMFEIGFNHIPIDARTLTSSQVQLIQNHLSMVFEYEIDPSIATPGSEQDNELNQLHGGSGIPNTMNHIHTPFGNSGPEGLVRC